MARSSDTIRVVVTVPAFDHVITLEAQPSDTMDAIRARIVEEIGGVEGFTMTLIKISVAQYVTLDLGRTLSDYIDRCIDILVLFDPMVPEGL